MGNSANSSIQKFIAISALLAVLLGPIFAVPQASAVAAPCTDGAIIGNGSVVLGVDCEGQLNIPYRGVSALGLPTSDPTPWGQVGLRDGTGKFESTASGCPCEGWGIGTADGAGLSGFANNDFGGNNGLIFESFVGTDGGTTAVSTVRLGDTLRVIHSYAPSTESPNMYQVTVTVTNIGVVGLTDVQYTRIMDWDIDPTRTDEFVTHKGVPTTTLLIHSGDDGFRTNDPLTDDPYFQDSATENVDFNDNGPDDHGSAFDFQLGPIGVGESKTIKTFYGQGANQVAAEAHLAAIGAELYSLGQSNEAGFCTNGYVCDGALVDHADDDGSQGPTFIFAFGSVGGEPVLNTPPTLGPIADQTINPGETATFTATATDPDEGQTMTFSLSGEPPGATINPSTGEFSWATDPSITSGSSYTFDVKVSDGFAEDTESVTIFISGFVIPESPIGILALVGTALAALGAFAVLQRRRNNNVGDYTGSFGLGV